MISPFGYFKIAGVVGIITVCYLGYNHYTGLIEANAALRENNANLETAIELEKQAFEAAQKSIEEHEQVINQFEADIEHLQVVIQDASRQTRRVNDVFASHDLTMLAYEKPGLIANRINAGTAQLLTALECATGSSDGSCSTDGDP